MVSLIYDCSGDTFHGAFVARLLYLRKASDDIRHHIQTVARLVVTYPFEQAVCSFILLPGATINFRIFVCQGPEVLNSYNDLQSFYRAMSDHHPDPLNSMIQASRAGLNSRNVFRQIAKDFMRKRRAAHESQPFLDSFISFLANISSADISSSIADPREEFVAMCLEIMAAELHFNIPSSFLRKQDAGNLTGMAEAKISPQLRYACSHWAHHVTQLENTEEHLVEKLIEFFHLYFLPWLEVLSILDLSPLNTLEKLSLSHVRCSQN